MGPYYRDKHSAGCWDWWGYVGCWGSSRDYQSSETYSRPWPLPAGIESAPPVLLADCLPPHHPCPESEVARSQHLTENMLAADEMNAAGYW